MFFVKKTAVHEKGPPRALFVLMTLFMVITSSQYALAGNVPIWETWPMKAAVQKKAKPYYIDFSLPGSKLLGNTLKQAVACGTAKNAGSP